MLAGWVSGADIRLSRKRNQVVLRVEHMVIIVGYLILVHMKAHNQEDLF